MGRGAVVIISCYELGHQPLAAASAVAFLERAGHVVRAVDLMLQRLDDLFDADDFAPPRLVAVSVPMHTAMHIGARAARRMRERWPATHVCFYGLYATLNADYLLDGLADSVIGGEFEQPLVELADALHAGRPLDGIAGLGLHGRAARPHLERLRFPAPARDALPAPERYARLQLGDERRPAAAVEASRGCLHHCRHCPIPPVYGGRFFVVPRDVVLQDARRLVQRGVRHLTFADPDFLNGPGHSLAIVRALHAELPHVTFDITTKVEHVLRHRKLFPELRRCGCAFVVSAVESLSDVVLAHLDKGHTRADVFEACGILDDAGIPLRPSLLPFTPWSTLRDYHELLDWIDREHLVDHVDPVQLSIRLLVPPGSLLVESEVMRPYLGRLRAHRFAHDWVHPDPRVDRLQTRVAAIVRDAALSGEAAGATYASIDEAPPEKSGGGAAPRELTRLPARARSAPPRLTEPWFC